MTDAHAEPETTYASFMVEVAFLALSGCVITDKHRVKLTSNLFAPPGRDVRVQVYPIIDLSFVYKKRKGFVEGRNKLCGIHGV